MITVHHLLSGMMISLNSWMLCLMVMSWLICDWSTALAKDYPENYKYQYSGDTSSSKLFCTIPCNQSPEKIIHLCCFMVSNRTNIINLWGNDRCLIWFFEQLFWRKQELLLDDCKSRIYIGQWFLISKKIQFKVYIYNQELKM